MRAIYTIIIMTAATIFAFGQNDRQEVQEMVFDQEMVHNWKEGRSKTVNGHTVTKIKDGDDRWHRTNLLYRSPQDVANDMELREDILIDIVPSDNGVVSTRNVLVSDKYTVPAGGQLALFYDRSSQSAANTEVLTIVIRSTINDEELYRFTLNNDSPWYFDESVWFNYKLINIPEYVGHEFNVEIYDENIDDSFEFNIVREAGEEPILLDDMITHN